MGAAIEPRSAGRTQSRLARRGEGGEAGAAIGEQATLKLYGENNPAPNPRKVRIFLAEKGIEVEQVRVAMMKREHKAPEFLKKNSLGQLPVLELDDGSHLSESLAICRYLEALTPKPALFGETALEQALIEMWIRRAEFRLWSPMGQVWINADPRTAIEGYIRSKMALSATRPHASKVWANELLHGAAVVKQLLATALRETVGAKAAVIDHWIARGLMQPVDSTHLFFTIWAATQTYADFDVQVCSVLGREALNAVDHARATEHVVAMLLRGCGLNGVQAD